MGGASPRSHAAGYHRPKPGSQQTRLSGPLMSHVPLHERHHGLVRPTAPLPTAKSARRPTTALNPPRPAAGRRAHAAGHTAGPHERFCGIATARNATFAHARRQLRSAPSTTGGSGGGGGGGYGSSPKGWAQSERGRVRIKSTAGLTAAARRYNAMPLAALRDYQQTGLYPYLSSDPSVRPCGHVHCLSLTFRCLFTAFP